MAAACAPFICLVPWTASNSPWDPRDKRARGASARSRNRGKGSAESREHRSFGARRPPKRSWSNESQESAVACPKEALLEEVERLVAKHHFELNTCFDKWLRRLKQAQPLDTANHEFHLTKDLLGPPIQAEKGPEVVLEKACDLVPTVHRDNNHIPNGHGSPKPTLWPDTWQEAVSHAQSAPAMIAHKSSCGLIEEVKRNRRRRKRSVQPFQELLASRVEQGLRAQNVLQWFFSSRVYEVASGLVIFLNAVFMGIQTQYIAERTFEMVDNPAVPGVEVPLMFLVSQALFTFFFTLELALRWMSEGFFDFFRYHDRWWNAFDCWVVSLSLMDLVIEHAIDQQAVLENISVLRVTRIVRVVRVARVIRIMKFFRELRMMIYSILGSMKSLLWVVLILCMTFYVFGVTFTSATIFEMSTIEAWQLEASKPLRLYFGTVDRSILSLFMAMSGGNDWGVFYDALRTLSQPYRFLFLMFILFAVFAVVNIVTGVFVETALASNNKDRDIIVHEELEAKKAYLKSLRQIFDDMDEDDSGSISLAEFEAKLDDERVIAYFHALKLDVSDARTLFWLLDYDHSDAVNIDEFLEGCYRLQGEARSLDTKIMQQEVRCIREKMSVFQHDLHEIGEALNVLVPEIHKRFRRSYTSPLAQHISTGSRALEGSEALGP